MFKRVVLTFAGFPRQLGIQWKD